MKDSRYLNLLAFIFGMFWLITDWNSPKLGRLELLNAFFTGANLVYCIYYFILKEEP